MLVREVPDEGQDLGLARRGGARGPRRTRPWARRGVLFLHSNGGLLPAGWHVCTPWAAAKAFRPVPADRRRATVRDRHGWPPPPPKRDLHTRMRQYPPGRGRFQSATNQHEPPQAKRRAGVSREHREFATCQTASPLGRRCGSQTGLLPCCSSAPLKTRQHTRPRRNRRRGRANTTEHSGHQRSSRASPSTGKGPRDPPRRAAIARTPRHLASNRPRAEQHHPNHSLTSAARQPEQLPN